MGVGAVILLSMFIGSAVALFGADYGWPPVRAIVIGLVVYLISMHLFIGLPSINAIMGELYLLAIAAVPIVAAVGFGHWTRRMWVRRGSE